MPAIKSIQINPDLLSMSSKKSKTRKNRKREKKRKPKPHIKPNTLKKALLRRIKEHSNKEKKALDTKQKGGETDSDKQFNNDFRQHLEYLSNLSIQHKHKKKKKNKTLKTRPTVSDVKIHTELPPELHEKPMNNIPIAKSNEPPIILKPKEPELIKDHVQQTVNESIAKEPPYSCLKGGSKPTYREWKRLTQKNSESSSSNSSDSIEKLTEDKQTKIDELRERIKFNNEKHKVVKPKRTYKKRTIKRKYKFGKNKGKISVLVKNNKTRKLVQNEVEVLRTAPMKEVKEYLKKHYLYKSGSNAPNDVLRKTYMDAHLSGEINNKSTENLVHNFVNS